jgi:hypothetical protein
MNKHQQKERIFKTISDGLLPEGFKRSKSSFWVKELSNTIQFIHIHTFSYNYSFRVHLGIRVKNDSFGEISLNGPYSGDGWWQPAKLMSKKRTLAFTDLEHSIEICAKNLSEYIQTIGMPWFLKFEDDKELVNNQLSPLKDDEKTALIGMIKGNALSKNLELTNKILGL